MKKTALIFGVTGQDGSYMAELLYEKGYKVYGVVRNSANHEKLKWIISLVPSIELRSANILEKHEVFNLIRITKPDEIYNFAGSTNVFNAWENLDVVFNLNANVPRYILESILALDKSIKFFQASSCLIFGRDASGTQNESTPVNPIHPYGIAKASADAMVREFRSVFGMYCCSGILFNHESERRGDNFFSKKITTAAANIKLGKQSSIKIGNLDSIRDYGYAPNFMQAAYLMMQNGKSQDYVIGTGNLISMKNFAKKCFEYINLDYLNYIEFDESLSRGIDTNILRADCRKIEQELGWRATVSVNEMIKIMIDEELNKK